MVKPASTAGSRRGSVSRPTTNGPGSCTWSHARRFSVPRSPFPISSANAPFDATRRPGDGAALATVPMLVDSHCHLDFPEFAPELESVLARARAAGVRHFLTISTGLERFAGVRAVAESA